MIVVCFAAFVIALLVLLGLFACDFREWFFGPLRYLVFVSGAYPCRFVVFLKQAIKLVLFDCYGSY